MKLIQSVSLTMILLGPAAPVTAAPLVLSKPHLSAYVRQITALEGGKLCIVGQVMDPDGDLQSRGMVALVDTVQGKLLWQQIVSAPDGNAASRFVACRADDKSVYVGANVDTHSQQSLNQGLAYVYRFDLQGKQQATKELVTNSANSFIYDIELDAGGLRVAGLATDIRAGRRANAIFFITLDPALKNTQLSRIDKGAYASGAATHLSGGALYAAGNFSPASAAADALIDDFAVSKIVGGKYLYSLRPQKVKAEDVATGISATGEIISLGVVGKASTLTVVGADGKPTATRSVSSAFCQTSVLSADADIVYAARTPCGRSMEPARLVSIARKSGVESVVKGISGEPVYLLASDGKVFVIARKGDGSLSLQTLAGGG
jgi:hypothetical protein